MKTTHNKIITSVLVILLSFGCSFETFDEINTDPNTPSTMPLSILLTSAQAFGFNTTGYDIGRYAGAFTQHFAGNHATGVDADQYNLIGSNFSGQWTTHLYRGGLMDYKKMIEVGTENKQWNYVGIAKVGTAYLLGFMTDVWGDIPYSEALQGINNLKPKFDTQEEIYTSIQKLLDEAIQDFDKTPANVGTEDMVYLGNIQNWKAFAYALKARYHNHLSKLNPESSANSALSAVDSALKYGFTDAKMLYEGGETAWNPWYHLYDNNLIVASEFFMNMLQKNEDPRLKAYWDNYNSTGDLVQYLGKSNGYGASNTSYATVGAYGFLGKKNSDLYLFTLEELKFIEAEAALRIGDSKKAAEAYNNGIITSLNKYVPLSEGAGGTYEHPKETNPDPPGTYKAKQATYVTSFAKKTQSDISLEDIMTEKYKAMFLLEVETWTDLRRHDFKFPKGLQIPIKASTNAPVASEFIRREVYPQAAIDLNAENVPKNITKYTRLWWDK